MSLLAQSRRLHLTQPPARSSTPGVAATMEVSEEEIELKKYLEILRPAIGLGGQFSKAVENYRDTLRSRARFIGRVVGPFVDYHTVIITGAKLHCVKEGDVLPNDLASISQRIRDSIADLFKKVIDRSPTLLEDLHALASEPDADDAIEAYISFIELAVGSARRDDLNSLRLAVLGFLHTCVPEQCLGNPPLRNGAPKAERGFVHVSTGRLLCPRRKLETFDEDPQAFCNGVRQGKIAIKTRKWSTFLYPEGVFDRENRLEGLFRGHLLVMVYRHIFTGPSTALKASPGPNTTGRSCICVAHGLKSVRPEMIAYAAVLARFSICEKESWTLGDGRFQLDDFYHAIVNLFEDPANSAWSIDTIRWWQTTVWGNSDVYIQGAGGDDGYNSDQSEDRDSVAEPEELEGP